MNYTIWQQDEQDIISQREWIQQSLESIGDELIETLVEEAIAAHKNAYPQYSKYHVGASVLTVDGSIYGGCNSEVVSYSETTHAEQNAIGKAISEGEVVKSGRRFISAVCVVHETGEAPPCGRCRQIMIEHADNALIILAGTDGKITLVTSLKTLLPRAFSPTHLGIK